MPTITIQTIIQAPIQICFDLSRSIDLHKISTKKTDENAIAGITSGLIGINETVTWQARHFGIIQNLTSKITAYSSPTYFRDEQIKGIFKSFCHDHTFEQKDEKVIMTDVLKFQSPFGLFGQIFNKLILTSYLRRFLIERNNIIKHYAETDEWKKVLN